jgi:ABC-2 type transport system ATP-binding protein
MLKYVNLTKSYESGFTLGPVDLEVASGKIVAIFGQNGAGKSTLFQLTSGNIDRSSGHIFWNEQKVSPDAVDIKRKIGYLPQESHLPQWVTPEEVISWCAKLHKTNDTLAQKAMVLWDIGPWKRRPLAMCSHGMQKRVGLALATLHEPELLILDEAFNALDILHTKNLETLIRERQKKSLTSLVSTHSPLMAADLCDEAWIIKDGHIRVLSEWAKETVIGRKQLIEMEFFGRVSSL